MNGKIADLLSFINSCETISDTQTLNDSFGRVVEQFGIDLFSCTEVARPGQKIAFRELFGGLRPDWLEHYTKKNYAKIDPALQATLTKMKAFRWSDLNFQADPVVSRLFGEAREALGREGIVVPIHGPRGHIHVAILNGDKIDDDPATLPSIRLAAMYYAEIGVALYEEKKDFQQGSVLSARQSECLLWAAEGKSDWEIGSILGISENTVHRHIEKAKSTLGVSTRVQAVVTAWRQNLIAIHDISARQ